MCNYQYQSSIGNHRISYFFFLTTESPGLEGTSGNNLVHTPHLPPTRQGHLKQVTQEHTQGGFECLFRERDPVINYPGKPVPVFCHPQHKEGLPHVKLELLGLQFMGTAPCSVARVMEKSDGNEL